MELGNSCTKGSERPEVESIVRYDTVFLMAGLTCQIHQ